DGEAIRLELLAQALELGRELLEFVVSRRGRGNLELAARQAAHLAGECTERLEHEPREGPGDDPGEGQGESGEGHRLAEGRIELAAEGAGAEGEGDAAQGGAIEVHWEY